MKAAQWFHVPTAPLSSVAVFHVKQPSGTPRALACSRGGGLLRFDQPIRVFHVKQFFRPNGFHPECFTLNIIQAPKKTQKTRLRRTSRIIFRRNSAPETRKTSVSRETSCICKTLC